MKIIALIGPKQAGKDEAARILRKENKIQGKIAFAMPLKLLCSEIFNIDLKNFDDPDLKEKPFDTPITLDTRLLRKIKNKCMQIVEEYDYTNGLRKYNSGKISVTGIDGRQIKTPRELLQVIGTNFIRDRLYKNWHVEAAFNDEITKLLDPDGIYAVTDARFTNELDYLYEKFGIDELVTYYIERPKAEKQLKKATHQSELEILELKKRVPEDHIIKNNKSLKEYQKTLDKLTFNFICKIKSTKQKKTGFVFKKR